MKNKTIKYFVALAMLTASLFAMGCSAENVDANEKPRASETEQIPESSNGTDDVRAEKIAREYAERYNATEVFQDACVPQKYLLYNGESIIYLFAIEGAVQSTVISLDAIEKYKRFDIGNLVQFTIFNRTASEISFFTSAEDAEVLEKIFH